MNAISLPDEFEWYHWHAWAALLQAMAAAPLWYAVYVDGQSAEAAAVQMTEAVLSMPSPSLAALAILVSVFGPAAFATLGAAELWIEDADPGWSFVLLTLLGLQLWPVQFVAAWCHRRHHHSHAREPNRGDWKYEVSSP